MNFGRFLTWVALVASLVALASVPLVYIKISNEGRERRDQTCTQSEREHLVKVQELRRTYGFLTNPKKRRLLGPGLTKLVILGLPRTEREARVDPAPPFCNEPGIGLPEPDPVIPPRPHGL
jgi:hypothetical protein